MGVKTVKDTKKMIIETTINIVAEKGLEGFSINQITKKLGIAQGTIYFHFTSKEELLYECFVQVNREIASLFKKYEYETEISDDGIVPFIHEVWLDYFNLMISNGSRSLFYYAYRDSENLERVLMNNNQDIAKEMESFSKVIGGIFINANVSSVVPLDYLWAYLIDGTGVFVKHILRGHSPDGINVEIIWNLIFGGLKGCFG